MLAGAGARPELARGATPTPVVNQRVRARRAAAALVFTASHNPPAYQGLKVLLPWGGGAPDRVSARLAAAAERTLRRGEPPRGPVPAARSIRFRATCARSRAGSAGSRAAGDSASSTTPSTAAGAGVLDRALDARAARAWSCSAATPTRASAAWRPTRRPRGSAARAPGAEPLAACASASRRTATPTASRSWTPTAAFLSETELLALLVDHLARTGARRAGVAISIAHGLARRARGAPLRPRVRAAADRLQAPHRGARRGRSATSPARRAAASRGRRSPATRTRSSPVRSLAEIVARERRAAPRAPGRARASATARRPAAGARSRSARAPARRSRRLERSPPRRFDGARVLAVDGRDGLRLALEDGFVLWRASGTEPSLRVYAEAPTPRALARRLAAAAARARGVPLG